ncbi:hypothetical protein [Arthrobacter sp. CAL618]|uniref:hypothetical protein n=1 Tax=Arthrobacter sp. CAL618 TaxID=1055770 RepID=UPI0012EBCDDE|nr:hypothetical protein [Arthrobacter sp. CAL618]
MREISTEWRVIDNVATAWFDARSLTVESSNPSGMRIFWQRVLDCAPADDGGLADPLRLDPALRINALRIKAKSW